MVCQWFLSAVRQLGDGRKNTPATFFVEVHHLYRHDRVGSDIISQLSIIAIIPVLLGIICHRVSCQRGARQAVPLSCRPSMKSIPGRQRVGAER